MNLKRILKKLLPEWSYDYFRLTVQKITFIRYIYFDYAHVVFNGSSADTISDIVRQYHRLEKALSKIPFDSNRGHRAAYSLMGLLEKYNKENEEKNVQFFVGVNVLYKFLEKTGTNQPNILSRLSKVASRKDGITAGMENTTKDYFIKKSKGDFKDLSISRKSIRYYADKPVSLDLIYEALDIAKKTPSVCNRQGWHTWVVRDESILETFRTVHNGFADKRQNLSTLLVITFDKKVFDYPNERNQGFIDSGLYAMSVMYSLTYLGLASCPLNSNMPLGQIRRMKRITGIPDKYTITMFIAVGNYLDINPSPISYRYSVKEKLTVV